MDDIEMENGDYIDYDDFCDNAQEEALEDSLVEVYRAGGFYPKHPY